jgi:hypothetical protein
MTDSVLNPVEVRVLGSLVEKQLTTPDYYPLTLNALTNACNQTSNRDPVVSLDEMAVVRGLEAQSRVPRYGHKLAEALELAGPEVAALCVLMLRGPQTVGEVRGRTGRMHEIASLAEAEATLEALAARSPRPLVAKQPRQAGFKEQRYAQLLGGEVPRDVPVAAAPLEAATRAVRVENERLDRLEAEVAALRQEMGGLQAELARFRQQFE